METSSSGSTKDRHGDHKALIQRMGGDGLLMGHLLLELQNLGAVAQDVAAGSLIIQEGGRLTKPIIIQDGWASRFRILSNGRRQIIDFLLPGDCVGLHPDFRRRAMCSAEALTPLRFATVEPKRLDALCAGSPQLLAALARSAFRAQEVLEDRLVSLGRRSAPERIAHLLVELGCRLRRAGLSDGATFVMPLTQQEIADALGLSAVHVSRTLTALKQAGLLRQSRGRLELLDLARLMTIADLDEERMASIAPVSAA